MTQVQEIRLSGGRIRYQDQGEGRPLVFVHGLLVGATLWRNVVPPLAERFRCIVPDWPLGSHPVAMEREFDMSPRGVARLIGEFLERLELEDVVLVANDTGGALAQMLVVERPERIGRLVLTPCDSFDNFLPPLFRPLQYAVRVPGTLAVISQAMRVRSVRRLPMAFGRLSKRPIPAEIADGWLRPCQTDRAVRRDAVRFLRAIDARDTLEAATRLPSFDRPVLVAWATEDRVFPFAHAQRLAALFPEATLIGVPDSYSFVPEDQPQRLAALVAEFADAQ